jgi:hypothetical protein
MYVWYRVPVLISQFVYNVDICMGGHKILPHCLQYYSYLETRRFAKVSQLIYIELFLAHSYNFMPASYNIRLSTTSNLFI